MIFRNYLELALRNVLLEKKAKSCTDFYSFALTIGCAFAKTSM